MQYSDRPSRAETDLRFGGADEDFEIYDDAVSTVGKSFA
jgi:hypothetical protein